MNSKALSQSFSKTKGESIRREWLLQDLSGDDSKQNVHETTDERKEDLEKWSEEVEEEEDDHYMEEDFAEPDEIEELYEGTERKEKPVVESARYTTKALERDGIETENGLEIEKEEDLVILKKHETYTGQGEIKLRKNFEVLKRATLAEPEVDESDEESKIRSNLEREKYHQTGERKKTETQGGKHCFEILDKNIEYELTHGYSCDRKVHAPMGLPSDKSSPVKSFDELHQEICTKQLALNSSHASLRSISTCLDSLPSSRGIQPSKHNLKLDLECRICHDNEGQNLISPCHCAGTSKWVHESCIIRWIQHTKTKQCEICTCPITVKKKKKPIDQWTRPSVSCGPCNKLDIWYCFVLVLCVLIIIGFVVLQHRYDVTDQIETTVIFASIYVLCGMIIMMKVRYFWTWFTKRSSFWGNWKNLNEEWRIIEATEPNARSPVSPV